MTLATAFAETTRRSVTDAELRSRTLSLYRKYIRHAPDFVNMYTLHVPTSVVRAKIRHQFERQRYIEDLGVKNIAYMKGQMEFQETINFWKQKAHIMVYFKDTEDFGYPHDDGFVTKFLRGKD
ncbi:hypothetical protein BABINDRAFT_161973 [Babjeviella inositovora NRRL Y-12698]|uniref:NADH-ubiquinone oxidoreductase B14 subunit n=1 Tax=Babjeviella inositovora NRRL Y-12698 TaxID=984486 RepID=A0A1E3QPM0_9ASCO|nr:uncharacterized protein BABINDRAFT_161973 [Babjeviella inositovora NRRL Y-12698]ODQ79588.1 hypothetical protein BABINDRAFT_161973 [Babjeviella inositovora NRRL Y-12698]